MTQPKKEHPTYTKGPVSKIGETGGTVVYIFPGGKACVKKGKKSKKTSTPSTKAEMATMGSRPKQVTPVSMAAVKNSPMDDPVSSPSPTSTYAIKRVGERLVDAGIINSTQLQVALYDQKAMKLRLGDVLIARGWVDQVTLDQVLSD